MILFIINLRKRTSYFHILNKKTYKHLSDIANKSFNKWLKE